MTFEYLAPTSLDETLALLAEHGDEAKVLAGGTALNILMGQRLVRPSRVISLQRLAGLAEIRKSDDVIEIGAMATHRAIETDPDVARGASLLQETIACVATIRIRNIATIGGNLAHGDPALDPPVALIGLGARIRLRSASRARTVPVDEFFVDYYETVVGPDELVVGVDVPTARARSGASFIKFRPRTVDDYATVAVATRVTLGDDGICEDARIAIGSAGPTPIRSRRAEKVLTGRLADGDAFREAGSIARQEVNPISDARGSASYKTDMVEVFVRRSLEQSLQRASQA